MKILIATDGSEFSQAAVEKACELITDPNETEIKLVSVFSVPTIATEPFLPAPDYYGEMTKSGRSLAESYVNTARTTIQNRHPTIGLTEEVVMGVPGQTIIEIAEEWNPDMIVVGSHGRGFWSRALLGSVSDAVVHHAPCSVLVVRTTPSEKVPEWFPKVKNRDEE
jgi:nucleotide-binding universal stress UspA family protein